MTSEPESTRADRRARRLQWPVRVTTLAASDDNLSRSTTAEERLAMVASLTAEL